MLERETWGSGQIARPGYPPKHPGGEFFWARDLLRMIKKVLWRIPIRAKQVIDGVRADRSSEVHVQS